MFIAKALWMKFRAQFFMLLTVWLIGMIGYHLIESWPIFESFYMTVITITTVGFGEVHELSLEGRLFTILLVVAGVSIGAYTVGNITSFLVGGEARRIVMEGLLEMVGVRNAKGLVAALSDEADNVFAALTARVLNPSLTIVSRGEEEESEKKMLRAGANRVILPYRIGGRRMAAVVLQPAILDFLDVMFRGDKLALELMEIHMEKGSSLIGKYLSESDIRAKTGGTFIVGIRTASGELVANPDRTAILNQGDVLIAMGSAEQLAKCEKLAKG